MARLPRQCDAMAADSKGGSRRVFAIFGTAVFLVLAPGTVAGYVPWLICHWQVHASFPGFVLLRVIGAALIVMGVPVLLECFARFALQGIGTPAPVFPTRHLVVKGFYRFVRNPMYASVLAVLIGQALWFGSVGVALWAAVVWLAAHLFVIGYEEPTMQRSFGIEYETYRTHVPRWIPRVSPWYESAPEVKL
jgi:protein-S-isoprenylcysteine O-methyltransferase Ste14